MIVGNQMEKKLENEAGLGFRVYGYKVVCMSYCQSSADKQTKKGGRRRLFGSLAKTS